MSLIIITHPFTEYADPICSVCLDIQLRSFRNNIKEQWNAYNNDGKTSIVRIPFEINARLLWETPVTRVNGNDLCLTHAFIMVNKSIEQEIAMREAASKTRLDTTTGSIDGFLKGK